MTERLQPSPYPASGLAEPSANAKEEPATDPAVYGIAMDGYPVGAIFMYGSANETIFSNAGAATSPP